LVGFEASPELFFSMDNLKYTFSEVNDVLTGDPLCQTQLFLDKFNLLPGCSNFFPTTQKQKCFRK